VVYRYKRPFRDGSTHVVLEPLDFIARLAALVPRPRLNLTRFHGVFAPNFRHRRRIVPHHPKGWVDSDKPLAPIGQDDPVPRSTGMCESGDVLGSAPKTSICDRRRGLPGLRGATAGGRSCASCARGISASLHVIACVEEPALIAKILGHIRAREALVGLEARAPPADHEDASELS
jgi:hypothetical protein